MRATISIIPLSLSQAEFLPSGAMSSASRMGANHPFSRLRRKWKDFLLRSRSRLSPGAGHNSGAASAHRIAALRPGHDGVPRRHAGHHPRFRNREDPGALSVAKQSHRPLWCEHLCRFVGICCCPCTWFPLGHSQTSSRPKAALLPPQWRDPCIRLCLCRGLCGNISSPSQNLSSPKITKPRAIPTQTACPMSSIPSAILDTEHRRAPDKSGALLVNTVSTLESNIYP
jgi:hypothetical protein